MDNYRNLDYKGGKLSEIIIVSLKPFLEKIKLNGIKKSIKNLLPGVDPDKFVLKKIKNQLEKRRGVELGKGMGRADIQYRYDGIQIEFAGVIRFLIKSITITDEQIIKSFDSILNQIEEKYILDDSYIIEKIDDIVHHLSDMEIYKPKNSEEKTLFDLATLILLNYYKASNKMPGWIEPALANIGKGEFIEKWIEILADYISEVISKVSEDIFFDFKVTFDSVMIRTFLNKKTNKGQISRVLNLFDINVKDIIYSFAKSYVSPSFIRSASEILSNIAGSFLTDVNKNLPGNLPCKGEYISSEPFNITMTLGENVFSERRFRWFTDNFFTEGFLEYSYSPDFKESVKVKALHERVPKAVPVMNLGLIASYRIVNFSKYSVSLKNLKPGTVYYRIICTENCISRVFEFKISLPSDGFKFMVLADSQGMVKHDYDVFSNMFETALKKRGFPDFVVHLGDFVDDGNNENQWEWVLANNAWRENAVIPMSGNHEARINASANKAGVENSVISNFNMFDLPPQNTSVGFYYSFVYDNTTFIVLNTNTGSEEGLDKNQYRWALSVAKNAKTHWKILLAHKAPYSNGPHSKDPDVKKIGKQIIDLAYQGGIDVVIGGHDHVYARTPFMIEGEEIFAKHYMGMHKNQKYQTFVQPKGTVFIIPGTSGVKNYKQHLPADFPALSLLDLKDPVYSEVEIKGETLCFNAYLFDIKSKEFKRIDSFMIKKANKCEKSFDSSTVSEYISTIPDIPWMDHGSRINKAFSIYETLEYSDKINVKNYRDLLNAAGMNKSYKNITDMEIRTVKNKREFITAFKDSNVGTIITQCDEIKFENKISLNDKIVIDRDLCISGNAKLSHVRFILKEKAFLILAGNVCIDNTRKPLSFYPARDVFQMHDDSVLILNDNATINGGYGTGFKGCGINMSGENCSVYLNSSGHNFVGKGVVFAAKPTSKVIVNSGKYLSASGNYALNVNGFLRVKSGFIRSIKGYYNSRIIIDGGIIGEDNELRFPVPVECFGKIKINRGTIKARDDVSVFVHKNAETDVSVLDDQVDIRGKVLYN